MLREPKWESALRVIEPQITNQGRHVWPFNPSFPVDVRFFLLNRQREIPLVRPDHLEVIYIESGEVVYESREGQCLLKKGDIVVVGDSVSHRCRKSVGSSLKRAAVLLFLPELILDGASRADGLKYLMPFKFGECAFPKVLAGTTPTSLQVFDLIQRISEKLPRTSECSRLVIKTYLKMILALLANHFLNAPPISQPTLAGQPSVLRLDAVLTLVENRYPSALTVEEAANIAGLSRWQFMRLFKRVMGESFISYLHHFRIGKAQELLASTGKSIVDVSLETGFCDQSYFGMVFRKYAHMTPLSYRRWLCESRQTSALN
jgi:AraC family transcriptional regulator, transcriptional activator of pobA